MTLGSDTVTGRAGRLLASGPPVEGIAGRISVPPEGGLYIRDPDAARARALRAQVTRYEQAGVPVPKHLQELVDELTIPLDAADIDLVNAATGKMLTATVPKRPVTPPEVYGNTGKSLAVNGVTKRDPDALPGPTGTRLNGVPDESPLAEAEPVEVPDEHEDHAHLPIEPPPPEPEPAPQMVTPEPPAPAPELKLESQPEPTPPTAVRPAAKRAQPRKR